MKSSDHLFYLVKSLSKAEKRSFRLYSNRYSGKNNSNYSALFDLVCKHDSDTEKSNGTYKNKGSSFSMERAYLYSLILDSLVDQNKLKTREKKLMHELSKAEILMSKEIFTHAKKIAESVKSQAIAEEKFHVALKAVNVLLDIIKSEAYLNNTIAEVKALYNEYAHFNTLIGNYNAIDKLGTIFHILVIKYGSRDKEGERLLEETFKSPLLSDECNALSKLALLRFYYCKFSYYANKSDKIDLTKSAEYSRKALDLILMNPNIFDDPLPEIFYRHNYLIQLVLLKDYDRIEDEMHKLRESTLMKMDLPKKIRGELIKSFISIPLEIYIQKEEYDKGIKHIAETKAYFKEFSEIVSPARLIYYYNAFARVYFWAGQYKEALHWVNKILNEASDNFRSDFKCIMKVMQVIIHFELHNYDILEHLIKSTYRYLKKREMLLEFENAVLQMLRRILAVKSANDLEIIKSEYYYKFKEISANPFEKPIFDMFDITKWLEQRIS